MSAQVLRQKFASNTRKTALAMHVTERRSGGKGRAVGMTLLMGS